MSPGGVTVVRAGGIAVVRFSGDLDHHSVTGLEASVLVPTASDTAVVADLTETTFLDSGGLRLIDHLARSVGERGSALHVVATEGGPCRFALRVAGYPEALMHATLADATMAAARG